MITETAAQLRGIARGATDATGYFAALYARVTEQVARSVEADDFEDGTRMAHFVSTFAGHYLRSHTGPTRPRCWQAAFDVAQRPDLLVVQHLLLGINAHVNHDLPLAVVQVAGLGDLQAVRADFDEVNDVLAQAYGAVLRDLGRASRWVNVVAALGGGRLFNFSLRVARRRAWTAAENLHRLQRPDARERYRTELDDLVGVLAFLITRPPLVLRPLVALARRLEDRDPRRVTAALLGRR